jgi:hypothetical protein
MLMGFFSYLFIALTLALVLIQYFFSVCGFLEQDITSSHPIWFELLKGMPAAFVTLVIGGLAAYIAWNQYEVTRAKLKFDLFERRLAIYNETYDFLLKILDTNLSIGDLNAFSMKVDKASFLFGDDVRFYLETVSKKASQLQAMYMRCRAYNNMMQHQDIQPNTELSNWAVEQRLGGARAVFEKYLSFETWH